MPTNHFSLLGMAFAALASVATAGCLHLDDDDTSRAKASESAYQQGCFFGCPLDQPLLTGSHQRISVSDEGDVADVEVSSSDERVAAFGLERTCYCERRDNGARIEIADDASCTGVAAKRCDNIVLVHAKQAGEAEFELTKGGITIDRGQVIVRDAERARLEATYPDRLGSEAASAIELGAGQEVQLAVDLYDGQGRKLLASDGVSWSVDDESIASVTAWLIGSGKHVDAGTGVLLQAKAEGQTRLTIAVPGLERGFDVTVGTD